MNMPELLELRDAVTRVCADHNLHFRDPAWMLLPAPFDWNNEWPVVSWDGTLTGEIVNPADDIFLTTSCNMAVIHPSDVAQGGWTVDDEGFAHMPEKYNYRR
jgi:hypothetical protein